MIKNISLALISIFAPLFFSCTETIFLEENLIVSPSAGSLFYIGNPIQFESSAGSDDVVWISSEQGILGDGGKLISDKLKYGTHQITLVQNGLFVDSIKITIQSNDSELIRLRKGEQKISFPAGTEGFSIFSLDASFPDTITVSTINQPSLNPTIRALSVAANETLRDLGISKIKSSEFSKFAIKKSSILFRDQLNLPTQKTFRIADIEQGNLAPGSDIVCNLISKYDDFAIYLDTNAIGTSESVSNFGKQINDFIIPRMISLFGTIPDAIGNKKLIYLFTPKINSERKIIGFFNPADLFERNENVDSDNYNPNSNEEEIIYLAIPDSLDNIYLPSTIMATSAHELAHLFVAWNKWVKLFYAGNTDIEPEEVFLDEGLAHFIESAIGLGESGGNILFAKQYLQNSSTTSLCGTASWASQDSVERRGMAAMLLSSIVERKGMWQWNADGSISQSTGGVDFIRKLVTTSKRGIEAISIASGESPEKFFIAFAKRIVLSSAADNDLQIDTITGEPLLLLTSNKIYEHNGISFKLSQIDPLSVPVSVTLYPWTIQNYQYLNGGNSSWLFHKKSDALSTYVYKY